MSLRTAFASAARPAVARTAGGSRIANAARASYRQYSSNSGSSSSSSNARSARAPVALSLLGLGSVGSYFGLQSEKDPKTTQEGMRKAGSQVDYQQVRRPLAALSYNAGTRFLTFSRLSLPPHLGTGLQLRSRE